EQALLVALAQAELGLRRPQLGLARQLARRRQVLVVVRLVQAQVLVVLLVVGLQLIKLADLRVQRLLQGLQLVQLQLVQLQVALALLVLVPLALTGKPVQARAQAAANQLERLEPLSGEAVALQMAVTISRRLRVSVKFMKVSSTRTASTGLSS
ncbi:MAG: hypothetical protein KTR33_16275, partial [Gammaproteobacteria bacterium]|nr:hypothetical protein [Gammaproteobacteria bacterium]